MLESAGDGSDDLSRGESAVSANLSNVGTITVSIEDIVSTLQNNEENAGGRNPFGMHITPPITSEAAVDTYVLEDGGIRSTPIDGAIEVLPITFITGMNKPDFDPIPDECVFPSKLDQRKAFREAYGYTDDAGSPTELSPDQLDDWESWWQRAISEWRSAVKDNLVEEVSLQPSTTDRKITVTYSE